MCRHNLLIILALFSMILVLMGCSDSSSIPSQKQSRLPNFVVIFAADLGYADIGTFGALSGADLPQHSIDGVNILPLMEAKPLPAPRKIQYYCYGNQLQCIRKGKWKLHFPHSYRSYRGVEPGMAGVPGP